MYMILHVLCVTKILVSFKNQKPLWCFVSLCIFQKIPISLYVAMSSGVPFDMGVQVKREC